MRAKGLMRPCSLPKGSVHPMMSMLSLGALGEEVRVSKFGMNPQDELV